MNGPEQYSMYLSPEAQYFPVVDWNVKFYGSHMQKVKKGWHVPQESHRGFELIFIVEGMQRTKMEHRQFDLRQGDILLIPPGLEHTNDCVDEGGLVYFTAHFNVDDPLFRQQMSGYDQLLFARDSNSNRHLTEVIKKWLHLLKKNHRYTTADLFSLQAILFEVLSILARESLARLQETVSPTTAHYATLIAEAIKAHLMADRLREEGLNHADIRIEHIAASLNISTGYALETFQKVYQISPRKYLSELKLHEAKQLIHQPKLNLSQVATMLGYSSLSHFSRQFKRWTGMSPTEYRQTMGRISFNR